MISPGREHLRAELVKSASWVRPDAVSSRTSGAPGRRWSVSSRRRGRHGHWREGLWGLPFLLHSVPSGWTVPSCSAGFQLLSSVDGQRAPSLWRHRSHLLTASRTQEHRGPPQTFLGAEGRRPNSRLDEQLSKTQLKDGYHCVY